MTMLFTACVLWAVSLTLLSVVLCIQSASDLKMCQILKESNRTLIDDYTAASCERDYFEELYERTATELAILKNVLTQPVVHDITPGGEDAGSNPVLFDVGVVCDVNRAGGGSQGERERCQAVQEQT